MYQGTQQLQAGRPENGVPRSPGIRLDRTLCFDLDSLEQKRTALSVFTEGPNPGFDPEQTDFAGILRAADLLSTQLVLLDVHLLDGALFLSASPDGVRSMLGCMGGLGNSLMVAARKPSLEESLRHMLLGDDTTSTVLARFEFSSVSAFCGTARPLAERLHRRSSARLQTCEPQDIPGVVAAELQAAWEFDDPERSLTVPTGAFALLEQAWTAWIHEAHIGRLVVEQWSGDLDLPAVLDERPVNDEVLSLSDPAVREAVDFLSGTTKRSIALSYLRREQERLGASTSHLHDWWTNAYYDALATMHGTNWLRFKADPGTDAPRRRLGLRQRASGPTSTTIQFQGSLVSTLTVMPPAAYALLRHQARDAIRDWQTHPSQKTSDGLAFAVAQANATVSRKHVRRTARNRVGLTLLPVLIGVLTSEGFSHAMGLGNGAGIGNVVAGVVSAVGAVAVGVPLVEFFEFRETRRKKMRAHIHFPVVP